MSKGIPMRKPIGLFLTGTALLIGLVIAGCRDSNSGSTASPAAAALKAFSPNQNLLIDARLPGLKMEGS